MLGWQEKVKEDFGVFPFFIFVFFGFSGMEVELMENGRHIRYKKTNKLKMNDFLNIFGINIVILKMPKLCSQFLNFFFFHISR